MTDRSLEPAELSDIGLFGCLDDGALSLIVERASHQRLEPGDLLFEQGARGREMFVILAGRVELVRHTETGPVPLGTISVGDWCGEMALIDVLGRPHSARAVEPTRVMSLGNRDIEALYRSNLKMYALFVMNLARQLSRKLRECHARCSEPPQR